MTFNNLAICVGPNLLSPPKEELLPLDALLEVTQKVNMLTELLMENFSDIFGEETAGLSCISAKESPAPMERSTDGHLEEQSGPAGREDENHQVPPSSTAMTSNSATEPLEKLEEPRSPSEERRFAGSPKDKEKERKRKRKLVWREEDDSQMEKKRKKRGNVLGDRARRYRKVQRFRKPRSRFSVKR
nr:T-cell activation Rho GTPase-activating protein-like [Columba livia]